MKVTDYRRIVRSLVFLTNTRQDIAYVVLLVSRYMNEPSQIHMKASKRILRYVKGILDFGIHYYATNEKEFVGFNDSDLGASWDDWKSTSGNCFSLGSGVIHLELLEAKISCPFLH